MRSRFSIGAFIALVFTQIVALPQYATLNLHGTEIIHSFPYAEYAHDSHY